MKKVKQIVYLIFSFFIWLGFGVYSNAQTITTPQFAFTQACASSTFNTFQVSFNVNVTSGSFTAANVFTVELSNAAGNFTAPVTLATVPNGTPPYTVNVSMPTNAYGESYKIRVRSSAPVKTSGSSVAFPAYYAVHNQPFAINNNVGVVNLCSGNSYNLAITNTGTPASPLYYPQLTYKWYKDFVEIPGQTGASIPVTQAGSYYAVTNYGSCVYSSQSNVVTVNVQTVLTPQITTNDGTNVLCPGGTKTLTSDVTDPSFTYTWYRNNSVIPGATQTSYQATLDGIYHLMITGGGCVFITNDIDLDLIDFSIAPDPPAASVIIPGQTVILSGVNDAQSPVYKWYRNNAVINGATQISYNATQAGSYKVEVTEPTPCNITKVATFEVTYPETFDLAIQTAAGYQSCTSTSATLNISVFNAISGSTTTNLIGNSYGYAYQWFRNGTAVAGATSSQLIVNNAANNGSYVLKVTMPGYGELESNAVTVNLGVANATISGPTSICEGAIAALTSNVTDASFIYQWYKDGILIPAITTSTLAADAAGDYYLRITSGTCTTQSNTIHVSVTGITVSSTNPATDVIIPGQTKTLTVTTSANGPQYAWYRNNVAISGATSASYTATQDGTYKVVVTQSIGCNATKEATFVLNYPSGFTLTIAPAPGYTACTSTTATLVISSFTAQTPSGNVNVASMGYAYQWYRNNVPVTGATAATLTVNSSSLNGTYKLVATIPNVPAVSSNDYVINLAMEPITVTGNAVFCTGSSVVLSASVNSPTYTYQWYKDTVLIPGATAVTYTANTLGNYHVVVTGGTCTTQTPVFALQEATISINLNVTATDVILPGQPKTINVTTNAASPTYVWYRNNVVISGATSASYSATQDGTYKVVVTQTVGCAATAESTFVLNYPSGLNLSIAADGAYTACSSTIATVSLSAFTATTPSGNVNVAGLGYAYQWYKNNVAVPGATSASLIVSSASDNGTYRLEATVPSFGVIVSNNVTINLAVEAVVITNASGLCAGGSVAITSNVTNPGYTYQWFKDTVTVAGETSPSITVNTAGSYYLVVTGGTCTVQSNTINMVVSGITVNTTNPATDIIMPGQPKTLSVTTDAVSPAYVWYRNNVVIPGATAATYSATQDGTYKVVVTQTVGCAATAERTFVLTYPSGFNLTITTNAAYSPCVSNSVTLSISSFTATTPSGPVNVSSLGYTYQWYKGSNPVPGATASTLFLNNASQNGSYKVVVNVPDFAPVNSNSINVNIAIPTGGLTIVKSGTLCEGSTIVLSSNITDAAYTYQWSKDGVAVAGVNAPTYTVSEAGNYQLVVTSGSCTAQSNVLNVIVSGITVSSTNPTIDTILPGATKTLTVTTDAVLPVYEWYRNNVLLPGETSASITATQDGDYKVVVTQTAGCAAVEQKIFTLQYPLGFQITVAADGTYTQCTSASTSMLITAFTAQTPTGDIVVNVPGYSYQWYKNDVAIAGATSVTLALNGVTDSGDYKLQVTIPQFSPIFSNTVIVKLAIDPVVITAAGPLCQGSTVALTSNTTNPSYSYQWYKDGVAETGANASSYTASAAGSYYQTVTFNGCTYQSNAVTLQIAVIAINSTSPATDIILPGQTKIITVTTDAAAPTYTWYRNNVLLTETSATLTATQNGTYKVVVTQTSGCTATQEKIFVLNYPTGFQLASATGPSYTACTSSTVTLSISNFIALTPSGNINVASIGYQYQWYKDNVAIPGATSATLTLNNPSQNGVYRVEATIPDFAPAVSNNITVALGLGAGAVSITSSGTLCDAGSQVTFTSNITDPSYTYEWFKDGTSVSTGTNPVYIATEPGAYSVKVTAGGCTTTSNTLTIEQSTFSLTATSAVTDIIIPGQTKVLSVTTDALQPTFVWYRNGTVIAGATTSSVTVTLAGEYKVVVTQNQDCIISKEVTFDLTNPSGFALTIGYQNYQSCISTQVNLSITEFKAVTDTGIVDLINNNFGYAYQWYKDGGIIPGATQITYLATQTGIYTLEVNIPDFGIVTSNGVAIQLAFVENVTIAMDEIFCTEGTEVTIYSNVTNHDYLYTWYRNDNSILTGTDSSITVSEVGTYHLEVIYNGCTISSNELVLEPFDMEQITISVGPEVDLPEGTSMTVTAYGADEYTWYKNGVVIGHDDHIVITEPGSYEMKVVVGECEVTRAFFVSIVENTLIAIPNLISPNNDGINDKWAIPLKYLNDDTEVVVYGTDGTIVLKQTHYNNNWPEEDFEWSRKSSVYYYTIMEKNVVTRRGSITIVK
ncbi:T9SS type B sorting domain-containing protein [Flavobacterium suzhouense]|uniref:Gliding motility-associated C-terminal domain-containing protein n=1 Tax=Flavobacterium suzhouense TaxID=1529638 RepID=A0ABW5NR41_9FLAO